MICAGAASNKVTNMLENLIRLPSATPCEDFLVLWNCPHTSDVAYAQHSDAVFTCYWSSGPAVASADLFLGFLQVHST